MEKVITDLRCHGGVQIRNSVVTSINAEKHKVELEPGTFGITVKTTDKEGTLIPWAMIQQATVKFE